MAGDQLFNLGEAILWFVIGTILLCRLPFVRRFRRLTMVAAVAFLLFGLSDVIEIRTRAWYRPWSLLFLKAGCIAVLVGCFVRYQRLRGRSDER